jgi:hypothetical protein
MQKQLTVVDDDDSDDDKVDDEDDADGGEVSFCKFCWQKHGHIHFVLIQ